MTHAIAQRLRLRFGRRSQSGQTMTEYALILALVVVVGLATWTVLGTKITDVITGVNACL